jgi:protein-L-isoaspartate(D-aspartate) O-methyltransferase
MVRWDMRNKMVYSIFAICIYVALMANPLWNTEAKADCSVEQFKDRRETMVSKQIAARGVHDPAVLNAIKTVPRHCFVPERLKHRAYSDGPLPIGHGQTISQPYIVAVMSELLDIKPGQRVLEVGTGSGYQAAILAAMGVLVYSIEIVEPLGKQAAETLDALGYGNIKTHIGDGYKGWPRYAPFDGIIVTCAPSKIPQPLKEQLIEGGRMVIPVGHANTIQELFLLKKTEGRTRKEKVFDVRFVPMVDEKGDRY